MHQLCSPGSGSLPSRKDNKDQLWRTLPRLERCPSSTLKCRLYILFPSRVHRSNEGRLFIIDLDPMSLESLHEVDDVSFHFIDICVLVK
jgi:hypothetical protein